MTDSRRGATQIKNIRTVVYYAHTITLRSSTVLPPATSSSYLRGRGADTANRLGACRGAACRRGRGGRTRKGARRWPGAGRRKTGTARRARDRRPSRQVESRRPRHSQQQQPETEHLPSHVLARQEMAALPFSVQRNLDRRDRPHIRCQELGARSDVDARQLAAAHLLWCRRAKPVASVRGAPCTRRWLCEHCIAKSCECPLR